MAAIGDFNRNITRARAILAHAEALPSGTDVERLLRDDLLRSAWMFGVGAFDAYFCDLHTDLLASILMCKERQPVVVLPDAILASDVPLDAVFADYAHRENWRWRMMARRRMERQNVLAVDTVKDLVNPFLRKGRRLFQDVIDAWMVLPGATRRVFRVSPNAYSASMLAAAAEPDLDKRTKTQDGHRNNAAGGIKRRFSQIIQRRHDCIHNCDCPRSVIRPVRSAGSVRNVLSDVAFLVAQVDAHVNAEFPLFLASIGCTPQTINQVGY